MRRLIVVLASLGLLAGCSLLTPLPPATSLDERLAAVPISGLPLDAPVTIRWDDSQIPFVEAETDGDAAFALGLVHAHLRLSQLAFVRRIVQGRLSESVGPATIEIDHAVRTLDLYRATDAILAAMPAATRTWLDRYVDGINHYAAGLEAGGLPHEFAVLAIDWEPWTGQDSIALGRAAGIDLNWDFLFRILSIEDAALRERLALRVLGDDSGGLQALAALPDTIHPGARPDLARFAELAGLAGRSGSNSIVVGPERSASGAALLAGDPHLAFIFPNAWMVAGLRSPSYEVVGMMVPGTPVFAFGRNEHLAWGGTALRARSSQLVDVTDLDAGAITTIEHEIGVRFWPDARRTSRLTPYGPILSDLDLLGDAAGSFAVRWAGHLVSDETTSLLAVMRARTVDAFREAVADFAFPALNYLAADSAGQIISVIAARVPARAPERGFDIVATRAQSDRDWARLWSGRDLPWRVDPPAGFVVSANDRPAADDERPYGGIFPQDERFRRLTALLEGLEPASLDDLAQIQLDVVSLVSRELIEAIADDLRALSASGRGERQAREALLAWDGAYAAEAAAPAIFETFVTALAPLVYARLGRDAEFELNAGLGRLRSYLIEDLPHLATADRLEVLGQALGAAGAVADQGTVWGDLHQLRIGHVLAAVPVLGRRYELERLPVSGSRETILKTVHQLTAAPHLTMFGSQARHLSDLTDPDANYFVLLGGQDGWLNSTTFADQVPAFQDGGLIRVPLTPEAVAAAFRHRMMLKPAVPLTETSNRGDPPPSRLDARQCRPVAPYRSPTTKGTPSCPSSNS